MLNHFSHKRYCSVHFHISVAWNTEFPLVSGVVKLNWKEKQLIKEREKKVQRFFTLFPEFFKIRLQFFCCMLFSRRCDKGDCRMKY